jgi:hypothetical protein
MASAGCFPQTYAKRQHNENHNEYGLRSTGLPLAFLSFGAKCRVSAFGGSFTLRFRDYVKAFFPFH